MNTLKDFTVRSVLASDHAWVSPFMAEHWGADIIVVHNQIFIPSMLPGFVAERRDTPIGLVTYSLYAHDCEIVTLDSLVPNLGVATALIESVENVARQRGAIRLWLVTTNDNLNALGFYQRRGFRIARIHSNAVEYARAFKPSIPQVAENLIPIVDEIELEKQL
jgi:DNA-3-methyladenine glycosylase I